MFAPARTPGTKPSVVMLSTTTNVTLPYGPTGDHVVSRLGRVAYDTSYPSQPRSAALEREDQHGLGALLLATMDVDRAAELTRDERTDDLESQPATVFRVEVVRNAAPVIDQPD